MNPARYLVDELPKLLRPVEGRTVQVVLIDAEFEVSYRFEGDRVSVTTGVADCADLTIAATTSVLAALADDTLDVTRALRRKELQLFGEVELLSELTSAREPSDHPIDTETGEER